MITTDKHISTRMANLLKVLSTVLLLVLNVTFAQAQTGSNFPPRVKVELASRGISEEQLFDKLVTRGLNPNELTPQQLLVLEPEIRTIISEIEEENKMQDEQLARSLTPDVASEIQDKIDDGATVEEAVSEEISETYSEVTEELENVNLPEIYGHQIFQNGSLSVFRTSGDESAPDSYRIGTGDELTVSIFGASQADFILRVDQQGFISPPGLSKILVKGNSVSQARSLVENRFASYYRFGPGQFSLNVNGSRTIRVNVFGEVKQSGTYSFSALNGALNALVAAGGPNREGSVRLIQRNRGSERKIIDVYEYLSGPSELSQELSLDNGDILFVPLAKALVRLEGAVKRPMIYEILPKEGLNDLIEFAGGLTPGAYPDLIQIERLVDGRLTLTDLDYDKIRTGQKVSLQNGDVVRVKKFEAPEQDFVEVRGAIQIPGKLSFTTQLKVKDVLTRTRLTKDARTDVAFLRRLNDDGTSNLIQIDLADALASGKSNLVLESGDVLEVLSQNNYSDKSTIAVTGAVRRPITKYPYSSDGSISVEEAILLAGGLSRSSSEKALLFRRNSEGAKITNYQLLDLTGEQTGLVRLNPNDSLVVFPKDMFIDNFTVDIKGAVRRPGSYRYDPSLGLNELLTLAGGTTIDAATNRIEIFRLDIEMNSKTETKIATFDITSDLEASIPVNVPPLQPFDIVVVRSVPEFELINLVEIEGEVKFPGKYPITGKVVRISDVINAAGGTTSQAFPSGATLKRSHGNVGIIVLELEKILANPKSPNNISLLPGDIIGIPKSQELVTINVLGTKANKLYADSLRTNGNIVIAYQGQRSAKWYVDNYAGGFDKEANRKTVSVKGPSGRIKSTKSIFGIKGYPVVEAGSSIELNLKPPKKEKPPRERVDWSGVATVIMAGLTTTLTTILIIDRL